MQSRSTSSLLTLPAHSRIIPAIENRTQFLRIFETPTVRAVLLRHCNMFELAGLIERAHQRNIATYVGIDHIDGIHADAAGLRYLAERMHINGIISNHPRILSLGKEFGLETVQRIFALDSTGLETALHSIEPEVVNILDISPALVVPHITERLRVPLPRPFIASGLLLTSNHTQDVLNAGAVAVVVAREQLWPS